MTLWRPKHGLYVPKPKLQMPRLETATMGDVRRFIRTPEVKNMAALSDAIGAKMTSYAQYFSNPVFGYCAVPSSNTTSLTAPGTAVATLYTASTTTTIAATIWEIDLVANATTAAGYVNIFLYNGTTYYVFDEVSVPAVTVSSGGNVWKAQRTYTNLFLPGAATAWTIVVTTTSSSNESNINCFAFGATQ